MPPTTESGIRVQIAEDRRRYHEGFGWEPSWLHAAWIWFAWRVAEKLADWFAKPGEYGPEFFGRSVKNDV